MHFAIRPGIMIVLAAASIGFAASARAEVDAAWSDAVPTRQDERFVAANGQPNNAGTEESPWDLTSVLAGKQAVKPGTVVWVRGGNYKGAFKSSLRGAPDAPIIVRAYPRERATLDGHAPSEGEKNTLTVDGSSVWFWGLEITNTDTKRRTSETGSWPTDIKGGGVRAKGNDLKFIHLTIHDTAVGFGTESWQTAQNIEVYGNLIYYNGWTAPDRGHGHGIYGQNKNGYQKLIDNIIFHQFSHGIHVYGSEQAHLNNFTLEGNICFENGSLGPDGGRNILLGGSSVLNDARVVDNYTFYAEGGNNNIGYVAGTKNLIMEGNVFAHGTELVKLDGKISGNVFGSVERMTAAELPGNQIGKPTWGSVLVRPSVYEPGRAHIAIFNPENKEAAQVDVSKALKRGEAYVVRDAQNVFGEPVASGRYDGGTITIPMSLTQIALPIGDAHKQPKHTAPEFAAFVLSSEPR